MKQKRSWIRGGILGGKIGLTIVLAWWILGSISMGCILVPAQMMNVGGADCYFKNYFSIYSFVYFVIPTLAFTFLGIIIGWLYGKIKNKKNV